jgi:hypothetical protein
MKNPVIILTTFKNNRIFNSVLKVLKTEYEIKEDRGHDLSKVYKIECPEEFSPQQYADYVLRSIDNCIKKMPDNYLFAIGEGNELGYICSFSVELVGFDKVFYSHRIKEVKK